MAHYSRQLDHYTKLTEIATTVQFVCHYWNQLKQLPNSPSDSHSDVYRPPVQSQIISS